MKLKTFKVCSRVTKFHPSPIVESKNIGLNFVMCECSFSIVQQGCCSQKESSKGTYY